MCHHHALCTAELEIQKKVSLNLCMQLSKKGIAICLHVHCFIVNCYHYFCCLSGTADYVHVTLPPPPHSIPASADGPATIEGNYGIILYIV